MHLSCVLPFLAEDIDNLATRIHLLISPLGDSCDRLVAGLSTLQFRTGDNNICGEELGICHQRSIILLHIQSPDEYLFLRLNDLDHLCLRFLTLTVCRDLDTHLIAVQSMHGITLGNENNLVVDHHTILAIAPSHEQSGVFSATVRISLISAEVHFQNHIGSREFIKNIYHVIAVCRMGGTHGKGNLLIIERLFFLLFKETQDLLLKIFFLHARRLLHRNIFRFHIG